MRSTILAGLTLLAFAINPEMITDKIALGYSVTLFILFAMDVVELIIRGKK